MPGLRCSLPATLFLYTCGATGAPSQVVQACRSHSPVPHNLHRLYNGRINQERPLDPYFVCHAPNGKSSSRATTSIADNYSLEDLRPLPVAFYDLDAYLNGVPGVELFNFWVWFKCY